MGKNNNLYVVYAGDMYTQKPVYENTKLEKAEQYSHSLMKSDKGYSKIYIERKALKRCNKRDMWDD